jgi:Arc/MetJ family transcription regulator
MRTTVTIDDEILARAQELTGINEKSHLILEALNALIQRESARRLARLGRSAPQIGPPPPRRR